MATAKKAAKTKTVRARTAAAKKTPVKKAAVKKVKAVQAELPLAEKVTAPGYVEEAPVAATAKRGRGRPAGTTRGRGKKGKAGRKAAQEFLYSIRVKNDDDGLGLDDDAPKAEAFIYVGPFASEAEATAAALEEVGQKKGVEIVVFRDFRRGTPETKVRLV